MKTYMFADSHDIRTRLVDFRIFERISQNILPFFNLISLKNVLHKSQDMVHLGGSMQY